ncbi:MAG: hypothetical protein AAFN59_03140 [Pseudomonadota bacterium]
MALIMVALVLRAQADGPSTSYLSAVGGLQRGRQVLSRDAIAHPCPHLSNQSSQSSPYGSALDPSTSKVFK